MNPASLPPGTEVGPWRVVARRGQGSYGVVYRVQRVGDVDVTPFALKLALHPLDPRFEREGELLSRIHHSHVPRLEARGWWVLPGEVPFPYLVMEWVEGVPLYEWAAQHEPSFRQAARLLAQVARALEATHVAQGLHRDVKGDNVLVREDGTAVLMDFGSGDYRGARTLTHQPPPPGTPQYQSPESLRFQWQWRASRTARYEAGPADDVYALGVMAYRLVTGQYPPPALHLEESEEGVHLLPSLAPVPLDAWGSSCPELAALIQQMLSHKPSARGRAGALAEAFERTALPVQRPVLVGSRWLAASAGVSLLVGVGWLGHWLSVERPAEVAREARVDNPEAGEPVGLAERALSTPVSVSLPEPAQPGLSLDLPQKPLPGQHRPPCARHQLAINGGCWIRVGDAKPPCGSRFYEWKSGCYEPMFDPPRPTTSGQP